MIFLLIVFFIIYFISIYRAVSRQTTIGCFVLFSAIKKVKYVNKGFLTEMSDGTSDNNKIMHSNPFSGNTRVQFKSRRAATVRGAIFKWT